MPGFRIVFILMICSFISVGQQKSIPHQGVRVGTKAAFVTMCNKISVLINKKQWKELNQYVYPEYGFYILDNPGVRPVPTNVRRFDDLTDSEGNKNEIIAQKLKNLKADQRQKLKFGSVPVWDCGTDRWNKKGSYCEDISGYNELGEHMLFSSTVNEDSSHPAMVKARSFSALVKRHVLQTSGYEIYFAFIDGKWYIAVINLCDKCSA